MKQKQKFLIVICAVIVFSFLASLGKFRGINFQTAILRGARQIAFKVAQKPTPTILLPVKFHKQEHSLSCEAATLKMALTYQGVEVAESELIQKIGFDSTPKQNGVWGDPNKAFVGNIDGKMLVDGYGVYAAPVARAANEYQYAIEFIHGNEKTLVYELQNGNPIIIWGHLSGGKEYFWKTPGEKIIKAINAEHTKVVHGFAGPPENPEGFFLIDPIYGYTYKSTQKLLDEWSKLDFIGVTVY